MSTNTEASLSPLAERRAARLAMVLEGYEVGEEGGPDSSVPGAARVERTAQRYPCDAEAGKLVDHPRYVLVTQYGDKGNYRVYLAKDLANVEQLARLAVCDGESISCYFDLDELAGPEPSPCEGDRVRLTPEGVERVDPPYVENAQEHNDFYVVGTETDTFDGEAYEKLYLARDRGADYLSGFYDHLIDEQYVEVVERAWPDERMPVRYGLARTVVSVVFNTVPSP
jgi:hypothetical protein